jgi:hypothetical protein
MDLESPDFDPVSYINRKFPNEESLVGLDSEIHSLTAELDLLNAEL